MSRPADKFPALREVIRSELSVERDERLARRAMRLAARGCAIAEGAECLAATLCLCRESDFKESFCITDALLYAAVEGDMENGLFYSGQSVTRIPEKSLEELGTAHELVAKLEAELLRWERAAA